MGEEQINESQEQDEDLFDSRGSTSSKKENSDEEYILETDSNDSKIEEKVISIPDEVRRSERKPKPKKNDDYLLYMCSANNKMEDDPIFAEEALARYDAEKWREAMSEELQAFQENDAWEVVDRPSDVTIVDNKWVFKKKCDSEGKISYRARLVARGFNQKQGIDYNETFSPVVRHSTLRLLIALSAQLNLEILHLDVKTAFLNGLLKEQVFMYQPVGLKFFDENKVLKLKKAIYGLKQSSRAWYERIYSVLIDLSYKQSETEPCLFIKQDKNVITYIALYVDDFFVFSNNKKEMLFLKEQLGKQFKIKDLGRAKNILGMKIDYDDKDNSIHVSQEDYIDRLL